MKTIGFLKSTKENEKRIALVPDDVKKVKNIGNLFFETGYGTEFGFNDSSYIGAGADVIPTNEVMKKDVICDPKIGDADYIERLQESQTIFGWVHAVENRKLTDVLIERKLNAIAWEDMFEEGRHVFWRNNELAGEAAILHAFTLFGKVPYECNVALLGRGNVARGAYKILTSLGATVTVYDRKTVGLLPKELYKYDVFVNGIMWDIHRDDHIIYKKDLAKFQKPAMIIDISCDEAGAVETSIPTSIKEPTYIVDGVLHYVVDHTPSLIANSVSKAISSAVVKYLDDLIEEKDNIVLNDATIFKNGKILDKRIIDFQKRIY